MPFIAMQEGQSTLLRLRSFTVRRCVPLARYPFMFLVAQAHPAFHRHMTRRKMPLMPLMIDLSMCVIPDILHVHPTQGTSNTYMFYD